MSLADLSTLYRQVIMDHANHPRNRRKLEHASHQLELLNPTCGDAIVVYAQVNDDRLQEVSFFGQGCSISIASASMMTLALKGKTLDQALQLVQDFNHLIQGHEIDDQSQDALSDAVFLQGIKQFPARYKCAVLAWKAMQGAIENPHIEQSYIDEKE